MTVKADLKMYRQSSPDDKFVKTAGGILIDTDAPTGTGGGGDSGSAAFPDMDLISFWPSSGVKTTASSSYVATPPIALWLPGASASGGWITNGVSTGWNKIEFPTAVVMKSYALMPWSVDTFPGRTGKTWTIEGSNDDITYTVLDTQTNFTAWSRYTREAFITPNTTAYKFYKINVTANQGDAYMGFAGLWLYGTPPGIAGTGGTGSGSAKYLDSGSVLVAVPTITIPIPAGYRDFVLVCDGRGDTTGNDYCRPRARMNGDSTTGAYDWSRGNFSDAGFTMEGDASGGAAINTAFDIGLLPSGASPAGFRGRCEFTVSDYQSSTEYKAVIGNSASYAAGIFFRTAMGGNWKNNAPVTSVVLSVDAGNFAIGFKWTLYGVAETNSGSAAQRWSRTIVPTDVSVLTARTIDFSVLADLTSFTQANFSTATAAIQRKRLYMTAPSNGSVTSSRRLLRPPSGNQFPASPWCIQVPLTLYAKDTYNLAGLYLRNTANANKAISAQLIYRGDIGRVHVFHATTMTAENAGVADVGPYGVADAQGVIAITFDGTTFGFWYTPDGQDWGAEANFTQVASAFIGAAGTYDWAFMIDSNAACKSAVAFDNAIILNQATPIPHGAFV